MDLGINIIGLNKIDEIIQISKISENHGFKTIWIGEGPNQRHLFPILSTIASKTDQIKIGTSILSVNLHRAIHVFKSFKLLKELFGNRFIIGLGRGGEAHLKMVGKEKIKNFQVFDEYLSLFKEDYNGLMPLYLGATGEKTLKLYGNKFEGVIINFVSPIFIKWTIQMANLNRKLLAIGPSYYLPNKKEEQNLIINSAIVASEVPLRISQALGIEMDIKQIKKYFLEKDFYSLYKMKNFLINNFSISGSIDTFKSRIEELSKIGINELILGHPIAQNLKKFNKFIKKFPF